jgi:DNA-binding transcriptional MocR family regulator
MLEQKYITGSTAVNIARSIEQAVASGRAAAGDPLPPIRGLASHLGVALATVAAAYRILQDRGITVADGRRGTRIRPTAPSVLPRFDLPRGVRNLSEGNPDRALLPNVQRVVRSLAVKQRLYGEEFRDRPVIALARRQFRSDGVPVKEVAVVSGALDGIERVLRERLRPGDRVLVEDPCFSGILDLLASMGLVAVPVPIDDEGPLPDALPRQAAAMIVTPRAQNPTGAAITKRRARQLRSILRSRPDLLIIEDDHAGPVAGVPYVTLVERDRKHWAVVRSVSKYFGPDIRVAMMAGDAATIAAVERRQATGMRWVSHILQDIVAALWRDRSLAVAEKTYTKRRGALLRALEKHGIEAHGRSGLNVWIPVAEETSVVQAMMRRGWAVKAGERYRLQSGPAIRVTIAALTEARAFASDLADMLQRRADPRPHVSA